MAPDESDSAGIPPDAIQRSMTGLAPAVGGRGWGDARCQLSAGEGRRLGAASVGHGLPTPWPLRHLRWWIAQTTRRDLASAGPDQRGGRWPVRSSRVRASSALRLPRATRPTSGIPPRRSRPSSWRGRQPALGGTPAARSAATPRPSLAPAPASSHSLTSAGVSQPAAHSRAYRSASSRDTSDSQWRSCGRAGACISSFASGAAGDRGFRPAVRLGRGGKEERDIRTSRLVGVWAYAIGRGGQARPLGATPTAIARSSPTYSGHVARGRYAQVHELGGRHPKLLRRGGSPPEERA